MHSAGQQPNHLRVLAKCFSAYAALLDTENDLLRTLADAARYHPPYRDLHAAGAPLPPLRMIVAGWAAHYRQLANGQRQIISQEALADVLGFRVVHVNRTLQQLRRDGLLDVRNGIVVLLQRKRLEDLASWTPPAGLPVQ